MADYKCQRVKGWLPHRIKIGKTDQATERKDLACNMKGKTAMKDKLFKDIEMKRLARRDAA
ncbi:MAG: hypothetical protein IKE76_11010, partial [Clostridia bacterium]|nr:hypothetical protein [Clostridia bacterium]